MYNSDFYSKTWLLQVVSVAGLVVNLVGICAFQHGHSHGGGGGHGHSHGGGHGHSHGGGHGHSHGGGHGHSHGSHGHAHGDKGHGHGEMAHNTNMQGIMTV